jgi:anti-sigma B factor antagonist
VYGALGWQSRSGRARKEYGAADVNRTRLEGTLTICPLDRVSADAAVPDGGSGSEGAVKTAKRKESVQLKLSRRTDDHGDQVISVAGELDIATAEQAYSYIREVIDGWSDPVRLDVAGLTFCDASGLGVLARLAGHARQAGRQFRLSSPRPSLIKIMRITGLDGTFPELRPSVPAYAG